VTIAAPPRPADALAYVAPNWFAAVMGTGIVAVAAHSLPCHFFGQRAIAVALWLLATVLLGALTTATAVHWRHYPRTARTHLAHPVIGHFYGAPPMALLTVGAGTLLVGHDLLGERLAVDLDWVLWTVGTLAGLAAAVVVPFVTIRRHATVAETFGGWLMPVVPPMVSASTAALLVPHLASASGRRALLLIGYGLFAVSALASAVVIAMLVRRIRRHGVGPAALVPTLWIVLGPLGQSVTAANLLGRVAPQALPGAWADRMQAFAAIYGFPVEGLALGWAVFAIAVTVRTARTGLPFGLPWWSFTFPVGTVVTGMSALAVHTGAAALSSAAVAGFVVLVLAWIVVAVRTARGVWSGVLLRAPVPG
jgi:C4-dicarboxylate transporter/malic acid transport protein